MLLRPTPHAIRAPILCSTGRILGATYFNHPPKVATVHIGRERDWRIQKQSNHYSRHFSSKPDQYIDAEMPSAPRMPDARERYSEDHLFPKFRGVGPQDAEEPVRK
jgi:hypothetical protein